MLFRYDHSFTFAGCCYCIYGWAFIFTFTFPGVIILTDDTGVRGNRVIFSAFGHLFESRRNVFLSVVFYLHGNSTRISSHPMPFGGATDGVRKIWESHSILLWIDLRKLCLVAKVTKEFSVLTVVSEAFILSSPFRFVRKSLGGRKTSKIGVVHVQWHLMSWSYCWTELFGTLRNWTEQGEYTDVESIRASMLESQL